MEFEGGTPIDIDDEPEMCRSAISIESESGEQDDQEWISYLDHGGYRLVEELDSNADGVVDARWTVTYEDQDRLVTEQWDQGADGTVDARRINTYNCYSYLNFIFADWRCDLLSSETDTNGDGQANDIWFLEYQDGNLIQESWDQDGDGAIDQSWIAEISADQWGNTQLGKISWDRNGDGLIDEAIDQERNDYGYVTYQSWDGNGDGAADERIDYLYDEDGYLLVEVKRSEGDTTIASLRRDYQFDENNWNYYINSIEADENGDGVAETRVTYQYDGWIETEYGQYWTEMQEAWFIGDNTTPSEIITTTYYPEDDYSMKVDKDTDADGDDDEICMNYSGWESGETLLSCDTNGDQQVDWRAVRSNLTDCATWNDNQFDERIRIDQWSSEMPTPSELVKSRAYLPKFSQVFEKARVIGTAQSISECYDCFW